MKFTTIIITKKKIIICFIGLAVVTSIAAFIHCEKNKTIATFSMSENYEAVLDEGLPVDNTENTDIKDILKKIVGFDLDEPETVAKRELHNDTDDKTEKSDTSNKAFATEETIPTNDKSEEAEKENTPDLKTDIIMPEKNAIHTASALEINNSSSYNVNINQLCADELPFKIDNNGPQVLIVHTHTTECYNGDEMSGETERTTDEEKNVVAIGNVIADILSEHGIQTIHDTTVHDYPSYQGAYPRALSTIESNINKYPSIKVVLDIHRDAFVYQDGSRLRVACNQNGTETAKVMIVAGTDSMGLSHPSWRDNLNFAAKIQNTAGIMYPGLMRPIDLRKERFNMHMTHGSLLLEVGSNGNSLSEATEGGADIARVIAAVLTKG